ncbi:unnamed protein product [Amoebophrya sp. A25]|nr:unnamed protein product [Amoebophrya sp. A25]|eukprot:GSA25T00011685001.1
MRRAARFFAVAQGAALGSFQDGGSESSTSRNPSDRRGARTDEAALAASLASARLEDSSTVLAAGQLPRTTTSSSSGRHSAAEDKRVLKDSLINEDATHHQSGDEGKVERRDGRGNASGETPREARLPKDRGKTRGAWEHVRGNSEESAIRAGDTSVSNIRDNGEKYHYQDGGVELEESGRESLERELVEKDRVASTLPNFRKFHHVRDPVLRVSGDLDSLPEGQRRAVARMLARKFLQGRALPEERGGRGVDTGVGGKRSLGFSERKDQDGLPRRSTEMKRDEEDLVQGASVEDFLTQLPQQLRVEAAASVHYMSAAEGRLDEERPESSKSATGLPERSHMKVEDRRATSTDDAEDSDNLGPVSEMDDSLVPSLHSPLFRQTLQAIYDEEREQLYASTSGRQLYKDEESSAASGSDASSSRRVLAAQPSGSTWDWLPGSGQLPTFTQVNGPDIIGVETQKDISIVGYASTNLWLQNEIIVNVRPPNRFGSGAHPDPKMKFVDGDISAREQCQDGQGRDVRMGVVDHAGTISFGVSGRYANHTKLFDAAVDPAAEERVIGSNQPFAFMHGGAYKICYAPDGDFVSPAPRTTALITSLWLPSPMLVYGVRSACLNSHECIKDEQWHCWYAGLDDQSGDCSFAFTGTKIRVGFSLFSSTVSKMTWTGLYSGEEYDDNGLVNKTATPSECRNDDPASTIFKTFPSTFITVDSINIATMPKLAHDQTGAFTVRVCYCGDYAMGGNKCDAKEEFIQAFGRLYIWRLNICDYANALTPECVNAPYLRVVPHQKFSLHITCPMGGACLASGDNRIGIIPAQSINDLMFWDATSGCMGASIDAPTVHWPVKSDSRSVSGGARQDYKLWRDKQPRIDFAPGQKMDVCFCQENCNTQSNMNWWKVGHVVGANFVMAQAAGADGSAKATIHVVRYMGKPGAFVLLGGSKTQFYVPNIVHEDNVNDYVAYGDGQRYSGDALLKIFPYDFGSVPSSSPATTFEKFLQYDLKHFDPSEKQAQLDTVCNDQNQVPNAVDTTLIDQIQKVNAGGDDNAVTAYHAFINGDANQLSTMKQPGIIGLCYCAILTADKAACDPLAQWRFAMLLMVSGPIPAQTWRLPTEAVSRVILQGSGFDAGDVLRIVPNNVLCTDNSNNPAPDSTHKIGCPSVEGSGCITESACPLISGISCRTASASDGAHGSYIFLQTLAKNQISPPIGIESVSTLFSTKEYTVLKFTGNVQYSGLKEGDTLLIDKNDLIFEDRGGSNYDISLWKTNSRMRELASVFTNNRQPEDIPDPTISDKRTNPLGWKIRFFSDSRIPAADAARYLQIPLKWEEEIGEKVVSGQVMWFRYPYKIKFKNLNGRWLRSSATRSNSEIKGKTATSTSSPLRVCWGRMEGSTPKFYADAGSLTFFDPSAMPKAHVSLTSTGEKGYSPIIISFELSQTQTEYKQYTVGFQHQLTLRFKDLEKLDPRRNTDHSPVVVPSAMDTGEVVELDAFQSVCGMLFVEMWSNDREGFPMPNGCYYSRKYRDASEGNAGNPQWRELSIVFPFSNGFKHQCRTHANEIVSCRYQLTLNAQIGAQSSVSSGDNLVDVYTKCPRCGPNGSDIIFEKGATTVNADSPLGGTQTPGDQNSPKLVSFTIPSPQSDAASSSDEAFDLNANTVIDAQLIGGDALQAITQKSYLRLYLYPLLAWEVPTSVCSVLCVDYVVGGTSFKCGEPTQVNPTLEVAIISLTPFERRNFLKVRMPAQMTDVITSNIRHGIQISSLEFPATGFFNVRMGAQLTDERDEKPTFVTSTGLLHKNSGIGGETSGRIVVNGATGYGPKPFHSQIRNVVHVRLLLGATLFHNGQTDAAFLEIHAPSSANKQYVGRCDLTEPAASNIPNFFDFDMDGYIDYNHGSLGTANTEGKWSFGSNQYICKYTLEPSMVIYAGMSLYIKITVDNPIESMTKTDPDNQWKIKLFSKGVTSQQTARIMAGPDGSGIPFNPAKGTVLEQEASYQRPGEPKLWYQNVGVVQPLEKPVLSPTHFRLSTSLRVEHSDVYIFFRILTTVGRNGYIKIDAPCGFDFGNQVVGKPQECITGGLPRYYYDYIDVNYEPTRNLTAVLSCTAKNLIPECPAPGPYNRGVMHVGDYMGLNRDTGRMDQYGFAVRVKHSLEFNNPQDFTMWKLFVADSNDFVVDGTRDTLFFQKDSKEGATDAAADKAFGLYVTDFTKMPTISVAVENLMPAAYKPQGDKGTYVSFDGFRLLADLHGVTLRFTNPTGWRWTVDPGVVFVDRPRGTMGYLAWPCANLEVSQFTQARFTGCKFQGMQTYGFSMEATVPDLSPTYSANVFYLELGFMGTQVTNSTDNGTYRYNAAPIDAPLVRALRNTVFGYRTARAGSENVVTIQFRLISMLTAKEEALVIEGEGKNALFHFRCDKRQYDTTTGLTYVITEQNIFDFGPPDFVRLPHAYGCKDDVEGKLYLYVNETALETMWWQSGYYMMEVKLQNLPEKNEANDQWKFGTFQNGLPQEIQGGPLITPVMIDAAATTPGFPILDEMQKGLLVKFADAQLEADVRRATGRDDRPGYWPDAPQTNQLIFRFQMKNAPNVKIEGGFVLRGPNGFRFANDCSDKIVVAKDKVFGEHSSLGIYCFPDHLTNCGANMNPCVPSLSNPRCVPMKHDSSYIYSAYGIAEWPAGKEPETCNGFENLAQITIPVGLDDSLDYVFRIEVESNPPRTPEPNFWSIEYSGEASTLFESFVLQTMTGLTMAAVSKAVRSANLAESFTNPVEFNFRPFQTAPKRNENDAYGGQLTVEAPTGYDFVYETVARRVLRDGSPVSAHDQKRLEHHLRKLRMRRQLLREEEERLRTGAVGTNAAREENQEQVHRAGETMNKGGRRATTSSATDVISSMMAERDRRRRLLEAVDEKLSAWEQAEFLEKGLPLPFALYPEDPTAAGPGMTEVPVQTRQLEAHNRALQQKRRKLASKRKASEAKRPHLYGCDASAASAKDQGPGCLYERPEHRRYTLANVPVPVPDEDAPAPARAERGDLEDAASEGSFSMSAELEAAVEGTAGLTERDTWSLSEDDQRLLREELEREAAYYQHHFFADQERQRRRGLFTREPLRQMEEQELSLPPLRRLVTNRCNLSLKTLDLTTIMVEGRDVDCEILANGKLRTRILSLEKELVNTKDWQLIVYVYNRANIVTPETGTGNFELRTFDKDMKLLDLARVPGFDVINIINVWQVRNTQSVFNGKEKVPRVEFVCSLPDALEPNDDLEIQAPLGFDLRVEGTAGQCNNFQWAGGYNPLPSSIAPLCTCEASYALNGVPRCGMRFSMSTTTSPVLVMNTEIRFSVDTTNPDQVTSEIGNHWVVFHKRVINTIVVGGVTSFEFTTRSTHAYKSWDVRPQLQEVSITIVGNKKAADAYTDIAFSFFPVQNAVTMLAEVVSPPGFKFGTCTVEPPHVIDLATGSNVLIVNSMNVQANVKKTNLVIKGVKLGQDGGQTRWNLRTYINELVNGQPQVPQDLRDERLSVPGFIMPGKLHVLSSPAKRLESDYFSNPSVYPTMSQFPAREQELNTAEITFTTTQTVYAGGYLYITCGGLQPYILDPESFSLSGGTTVVDQNEQIVFLNPATGGLEVQLKPNKPETDAVIRANEIYKVRFRVTPRIGSSFWTLETFALNNFALPSNTNDGDEGPFDPVYRLGIEMVIVGGRTPPGATITIKIKVISGNASVLQVVIIAPPTFDFMQDCGQNCESYLTYQPEGRKSVRIRSPDGMALTIATLNEITFQTITPSQTPSARSWFVQTMAGSMSGGFQVTGWARNNGFDINQMEPATVWYPQRRSLQGANFVFSFYFSSSNGRVIRVNPPVLYEVYCSTMPSTGEPAFFQVSLPGGPPLCDENPLKLTLTTPLQRGSYSFIIGGDVPMQDAAAGVVQNFALIILNEFGDVLDAAYQLPARNPLTAIRAAKATLNWEGLAQPGIRQKVHVGLDFETDVHNVPAILVTFPRGITPDFSKELVSRKRDVKNLNKNFQVAAALGWVDFSAESDSQGFIKILVEERAHIAAGRYKWEFYVQMPQQLPSENVWFVSLCFTRQCRNINTEPSSAIPITFPIPGFNFDESSLKTLMPSAARPARGSLPLLAAVLVALVHSAVFLLKRVPGRGASP